MPSEIFGLPTHPFAVHVPVVLVPLLALAIAVYVLVPKLRHQAGWALVGLSLATPVAVFGAYSSGAQLAHRQLADLASSPEIAEQTEAVIRGHSGNGWILFLLTLFAAPLALLFAGVASGRLAAFAKKRNWSKLSRSGDASPKRTVMLSTLGGVLVVLAVAMTFFVIRTGHSGAEMLWSA